MVWMITQACCRNECIGQDSKRTVGKLIFYLQTGL